MNSRQIDVIVLLLTPFLSFSKRLIAPCVNLLSCWDALQSALLPIVIIMVVTTVLVFAVGGLVTQWILKHRKGDKENG